jgi:hypothetical protein
MARRYSLGQAKRHPRGAWENVLAVMLGNGWYNMHTRATWNFDRAPWRDQPKMRAQLHVFFADGTQEKVVSDTSWRAATGPVILDGIYNGEVCDARLERDGWSSVTTIVCGPEPVSGRRPRESYPLRSCRPYGSWKRRSRPVLPNRIPGFMSSIWERIWSVGSAYS